MATRSTYTGSRVTVLVFISPPLWMCEHGPDSVQDRFRFLDVLVQEILRIFEAREASEIILLG